MKAVGKYIVITETKETTSKTKGGLLLAEGQREDVRYRKGKIVNIGNDVNGVSINDNIYYDKHAGFYIEIDGEVYIVIKENDVVIIL
jgi:co-chaperonin GroES (HSP10)